MGKVGKSGTEQSLTPQHAVEAVPTWPQSSKVKMADDREPPALFDEDEDTPESKPDETADSNPFTIGETTEITLDDGDAKAEDSSQAEDKVSADPLEEKTDLPTSGAAASVDVTNLSKPSEDESEPASKEKPEVGL